MTFHSIYDEIKKFDKEDRLEINDECDTITLTLNEIYKIIAYDNAGEIDLKIMLNGKRYMQFDMDYRETRHVIETAMLNDKPLSTEKELHKIDRHNIFCSLALVLLPCIFLMFDIFVVGIQTWIMPLRLLASFGSFPLCWAVVWYFHKRYKEKNKNIYDKIENLNQIIY